MEERSIGGKHKFLQIIVSLFKYNTLTLII